MVMTGDLKKSCIFAVHSLINIKFRQKGNNSLHDRRRQKA